MVACFRFIVALGSYDANWLRFFFRAFLRNNTLTVRYSTYQNRYRFHFHGIGSSVHHCTFCYYVQGKNCTSPCHWRHRQHHRGKFILLLNNNSVKSSFSLRKSEVSPLQDFLLNLHAFYHYSLFAIQSPRFKYSFSIRKRVLRSVNHFFCRILPTTSNPASRYNRNAVRFLFHTRINTSLKRFSFR